MLQRIGNGQEMSLSGLGTQTLKLPIAGREPRSDKYGTGLRIVCLLESLCPVMVNDSQKP